MVESTLKPQSPLDACAAQVQKALRLQARLLGSVASSRAHPEASESRRCGSRLALSPVCTLFGDRNRTSTPDMRWKHLREAASQRAECDLKGPRHSLLLHLVTQRRGVTLDLPKEGFHLGQQGPRPRRLWKGSRCPRCIGSMSKSHGNTRWLSSLQQPHTAKSLNTQTSNSREEPGHPVHIAVVHLPIGW